jgi:two-component system LytT family response regulator/two-component system response regulator LytT
MKESTRKQTNAPALTLSAIIVDDEELARQELAYLLESHPDVEVIAEGRNGIEAVELIRRHEPDIVFLDVQMPGLDGFGVMRKLVEKKAKIPYIVFATAFDQYAVQAFEVNAVDYLLKPIDKGRLAQAVERARKMVETRSISLERIQALLSGMQARPAHPSKLLVKMQNRLFLVDSRELIYATIEDGLITVVTQNLEGTSNYRTIEDLQKALDPKTFWRVHRSYLVNINRIKEVVPWFKSSYLLKMDDRKQTEIPVSRAQTKRLRELLKL